MKWLRIQFVLSVGFLVPSVLLSSYDVEGARKLFIALSWVFGVLAITLAVLPGNGRATKAWKHCLRVVAIVVLTPLAVRFALAGGDAMVSYLSSDAADKSATLVQGSYGEMWKIAPVVEKMWASENLAQLNGNFEWFYLITGITLLIALAGLVWNSVPLFWKRYKQWTDKKSCELETA